MYHPPSFYTFLRWHYKSDLPPLILDVCTFIYSGRCLTFTPHHSPVLPVPFTLPVRERSRPRKKGLPLPLEIRPLSAVKTPNVSSDTGATLSTNFPSLFWLWSPLTTMTFVCFLFLLVSVYTFLPGGTYLSTLYLDYSETLSYTPTPLPLFDSY